jgi:hypothetical protein
MKTKALLILGLATMAITAVAVTKSPKTLLTLDRIRELTAPTDAPAPKAYKIAISGLGSRTLPADAPGKQTKLENIREFRFPTQFEPPKSGEGEALALPTTPTAFEMVNTGWTVHLNATRHGRLVGIAGAADYVTAQLHPGGYGPVNGPIYAKDGSLLSENKLDQPEVQTTSTHFHIFAVPGESYEVTFYRGNTSEKHTVTVTEE